MGAEIETAEDFVAFSSRVMEHPTLEEVNKMLAWLSQQDRDFATAAITDHLLDMRADLVALENIAAA